MAGNYDGQFLRWQEAGKELENRMRQWLEPPPRDPLGPAMTLMLGLTESGRHAIPRQQRFQDHVPPRSKTGSGRCDTGRVTPDVSPAPRPAGHGEDLWERRRPAGVGHPWRERRRAGGAHLQHDCLGRGPAGERGFVQYQPSPRGC